MIVGATSIEPLFQCDWVMCVCKYVSTYVCVCMYVSMCVCMYVRMHVCMYACVYVCMHVCMFKWDRISTDRECNGCFGGSLCVTADMTS